MATHVAPFYSLLYGHSIGIWLLGIYCSGNPIENFTSLLIKNPTVKGPCAAFLELSCQAQALKLFLNFVIVQRF